MVGEVHHAHAAQRHSLGYAHAAGFLRLAAALEGFFSDAGLGTMLISPSLPKPPSGSYSSRRFFTAAEAPLRRTSLKKANSSSSKRGLSARVWPKYCSVK